MIFMDWGSCVLVEVLASPLSSEDSEKDGKDVRLRQLQQKGFVAVVTFTLNTADTGTVHLLECSS